MRVAGGVHVTLSSHGRDWTYFLSSPGRQYREVFSRSQSDIQQLSRLFGVCILIVCVVMCSLKKRNFLNS